VTTVAEPDIATLAGEIAEHLHAVRKRLAEEIRSYPTPITRCDAQFNHLYEQQARLARELDRIGGDGTVEAIERFLASAPYCDEDAERDFRKRIRNELAALRE
jgi:hypothetical protein